LTQYFDIGADAVQNHMGSTSTQYSARRATGKHALHRGRRLHVPELEEHDSAIAITEDAMMKVLVALQLPCSMPRSPMFVQKVPTIGGVPSRQAAFAFLRLLRMNLIRVSATDCEVNDYMLLQQAMRFEMDSSDDGIGGCATCTLDVMKFMTNDTMGGLPSRGHHQTGHRQLQVQ
jgi:hypothetical protein